MLRSGVRNSCLCEQMTLIGHVASSPFGQRPRREDECDMCPFRQLFCTWFVITSKDIDVRSSLPMMVMTQVRFSCLSQLVTQDALWLLVRLMKLLSVSGGR